MTTIRYKLFAIIGFTIPMLAIMIFGGTPARTFAVPTAAGDAAAVYKTKCAACHTPKATKFFDPAKTDEEHVSIILKGKKAEKPPHMPGFEDKGIKEEDAKELVTYMKTLRESK